MYVFYFLMKYLKTTSKVLSLIIVNLQKIQLKKSGITMVD